MNESRIGNDRPVFTVIFEFEVEPARQRELSEKIRGLVREIVGRQPGFLASHLHVSADGHKVLNYFQWESREAFDAFRSDERQQEKIRPVIGPYGPKPRAYTIAFSHVA